MTPFEQWFSSNWMKLLHGAQCDGDALSTGRICDAIWDRRSAYLFWTQIGRPNAAWVEQARSLRTPAATAPEEIDDLLAMTGDPEIEDLLAL